MPSNQDLFVPIKQQKIYSQIVEQIIGLIERGDYIAGTQLPAERELARSLGVSRASLREALTVLQMMGFVETRYGQGTFVCSKPASIWLQDGPIGSFGESPITILQARKTIEPSIASLAAIERTDENLERIEETIRMIEAEHSNLQSFKDIFSEGDRNFHLAIAQATGNPILINIQQMIFNLMGQKLWLALIQNSSFVTPGRWQEAIHEHRSVYEAVRAKDGPSAASHVRSHLARVEKIMVRAQLASNPPTEDQK